MLVAQISDLHIRPQGEKLYDYIDTNSLCARHVAYLNHYSEKLDALIITGDITNCGCPDEYAMAARILGQLDMPVYLIPGNHDQKENFLEGLGELYPYLGNTPQAMTYVVDDFPVRMVFLDSSLEGEIKGRLTRASLEWLDHILSQQPDVETAVFIHHHPLASGCRHMDTIRCTNGPQLIDILKDHPQVTRLFCGHTHRAIVQTIGPLLIMTAPSACHQVPFDTRDPNGFYSLEPPAMLVHRFTPETGLVTHMASLAPFDGPFRFDTTLGCPESTGNGVGIGENHG